ncbi:MULTISPECIES: flagellar biosynthesis protein FlhF [Paenibacillus]|uniref:flagellar biosynthesis protein FlhF n=1 Tax=Paenibacillus TaxID=44249 RepID=UPI00088CE80A|nr:MULTISPECIES: flagellar biosynthesis protein FlhF [Paenibacillus]TDL68313.1 flagellar biosynthesis protein FlhF [Paenibacillus amylolyticus]UOK65667.1 flagellar biosynthesis protein FlhF [Paenibacillus sp. OVF10]SDC79915.1 flagellar biosynthesis protein FlhF [Paenibacillus sp. CF095]
MRVKQYVVETMPEAMLQIRKDLGSDAVILSTKEIKVGGVMGMFRKKRIEVVAAVDKEENKQTTKPVQNQFTPVPRAFVPEAYRQTARSFVAASDESATTNTADQSVQDQSAAAPSVFESRNIGSDIDSGSGSSSMDHKPRPQGADFSGSTTGPMPTGSDLQQDKLMTELQDLKQMVTRLSKQGTSADPVPEELHMIRERLTEQDVWPEVWESWFDSIQAKWSEGGLKEQDVEQVVKLEVMHFLEQRIEEGILPTTRIVYVAGPTGVGKTTTIAKLAAEQMFKKQRKVGFITSDTYRISAVEQLRTYASILNVPLEVVQSPGDTQRAISRLENCDLIFMDTAGRNYRNELLVSELQSLLAPVENSETFLVMSMTSKSADMVQITEHFSKYGLDKVIFTKMDETGSCGPLFNLLHRFPLKLAYVANGQNVPDDLLKPDADSLSKQLLGEWSQ